MTTPIPFEMFSSDLLPGEKIEWSGQPNPTVVFHREDWGLIPFSLMWGGFAIFWLLGASGIWDVFSNKPSQGFQYFGLIWGTPFVLIGQYLIWGRFVHHHWKKKRTYYALTDRRALIVEQGLRGRASAAACLDTLPMIGKQVRSDGVGSISFGGPVVAEWQWGRNRTPRPLTFEDVDNVESVYQIALRIRQRARTSTEARASRWRA